MNVNVEMQDTIKTTVIIDTKIFLKASRSMKLERIIEGLNA